MSVWTTLSRIFRRPLVQMGLVPLVSAQEVLGQTPAQLYRSQANLRTVVSFRARNVAQLGLQMFRRESDTDRVRVGDDPLIQLLHNPNPEMTGFELINTLVSDFDLYGRAFWMVIEDVDRDSGWRIRPIPPSWVVAQKGGDVFAPGTWVIDPGNGLRTEVPAEQMLVFSGWDPEDPAAGLSPVDALKDVLAEQIEAWGYRRQLWKRGGRIGSYLWRPKDAPAWGDASREQFQNDWKEFQAKGARAGSTPVLEDGMEMRRVGFNAREEEWAEVAKLSLATVAAVYHVNPVMVGLLENANFANTREFRKMLYSDTLGPLLAMIQDRINAFLVPRIATTPDVYVEFNIGAKLAGSFEEQAAILSTSVGAPWMSVNEARARQNLPRMEGGDDLVVPLNVVKGGQASPQDGGDPLAGAVEDVVKAWQERMRASVAPKQANGLPVDWERWESELTADLVVHAGVDQFNAASLAHGVVAANREELT